GPVPVPSANSDLDQILGMTIRQTDIVHVAVVAMGGGGAFMRRPEPRRRMHSFIHILFLDIDVPVDVNDADVAVDVRGDAADIGKAEAVIAPANDREHARRVDMRYGLGDLIERLFDVAGDNEN